MSSLTVAVRLRAVINSIATEWLWGWDPTPGIVSVWADSSGIATVWRRDPATNVLSREVERFRPWMLLDRLDDLGHLGRSLGAEGSDATITYRELAGPGALRYRVSAPDGRVLAAALLRGVNRRTGRTPARIRDLDRDTVF